MERSLRIPVLFLLASIGLVTGQDIGTEICACSPRSYEFTLDFNLTCPPVNIAVGDAVDETSCLISPFGALDVEDLVPVSVDSIDVLELGQTLRVIAQTDIKQTFSDGDSFTYTSVVADPSSIETAEQVPRALQINIVGNNQHGDRIINVFIVTFTNDCDKYPVFEEGQSAGWAKFTGLGPGSPELCSAIEPVPTDAPVSPTMSPVAPTLPPTPKPTPKPTPMPTFAPTAFDMSMSMALAKEFDVLNESEFGEEKLGPGKISKKKRTKEEGNKLEKSTKSKGKGSSKSKGKGSSKSKGKSGGKFTKKSKEPERNKLVKSSKSKGSKSASRIRI